MSLLSTILYVIQLISVPIMFIINDHITHVSISYIGSKSINVLPTIANQLSCHQTSPPPETNTTNRSSHVVQKPTQCPYPTNYNQQARLIDKNELKNYRPVSNLHFIYKVIKHLVAKRLDKPMSEYDPMQSAYKLVHSTTIYLAALMRDTALFLLASIDLAADFDTINHNVLLNRLPYLYVLTGSVFKWFQSYIEHINKQACVGDSLSRRRPVTSCVSQCSVLGARLFTMYIYTYHVALIFKKHKVQYPSYAYNTQMYLNCDNNVASRRHAVH